jgi:2-keto-3-deoxy-L-rhamnonate aldolase RhmA
MEHGAFEVGEAAHVVALCRALGLGVFTRVAAPERVPVHQALDSGADGVILPQIGDLAHAREATAFAKYPPLGTRGWGGGRTVKYVATPDQFVETENRRVRCYAMVETAAALKDVEAIAKLPALDGLLIGPYDLSLSCGRGEYLADGRGHEDFARIAAAARAANKPWGMVAGSALDRAFARSQGAELLVVTDDVTALREGLASAFQKASDEQSDPLDRVVS